LETIFPADLTNGANPRFFNKSLGWC